MKRKLFKSALAVAFAVASFFTVKSSFAAEDAKKNPIQTICCKDGSIVGYANNCGAGGTQCSDNMCLGAYVWESTSGSCNYSRIAP